MKASCPNCGSTLFDPPIKRLELWQRAKCRLCDAQVQVSDAISDPTKLKLINVSTDDDEGDD